MNYELRDGAIYPVNVNQTKGTVLRCPGCGCIDLKRVDGVIDQGTALNIHAAFPDTFQYGNHTRLTISSPGPAPTGGGERATR